MTANRIVSGHLDAHSIVVWETQIVQLRCTPNENARPDIRKLASVDNAGANVLLRFTTLVESRHRQLSIVGTLPETAHATNAHQ
jgi:anti-anti-sigma regulatory factor